MATKTRKKTNRIKGPEIPVPPTLGDAEKLLAHIGRLQRQVSAIESEMNDELLEVKERHEKRAAPITEEVEAGFTSLQAWAEAHRTTLLKGGRKSSKIATGEVGWRSSPPAVRISGVDAVIKALKALRLTNFIRTKEEVDKEAIRRDPEAVQNVKGISITKKEEFWIRPLESDIERARSTKVGA